MCWWSDDGEKSPDFGSRSSDKLESELTHGWRGYQEPFSNTADGEAYELGRHDKHPVVYEYDVMCGAQMLGGTLTTEAEGSIVCDPLYGDNISRVG